MLETRIAKDLPKGAEVYRRGVYYYKDSPRSRRPWVNDDGNGFTDAHIDALLADGGIITEVPTGTKRRR